MDNTDSNVNHTTSYDDLSSKNVLSSDLCVELDHDQRVLRTGFELDHDLAHELS